MDNNMLYAINYDSKINIDWHIYCCDGGGHKESETRDHANVFLPFWTQFIVTRCFAL